MTAYTIAHKDDMERNGNWTLCRRALDLQSFGLGLVEIEAGGSIPEHDEMERDQEEVFMFLDGATMVLDGEEHDAPAGTFVKVDPHVRRTVRNPGGRAVTVLIASAPRTSGYEPMGWN